MNTLEGLSGDVIQDIFVTSDYMVSHPDRNEPVIDFFISHAIRNFIRIRILRNPANIGNLVATAGSKLVVVFK